MRKRKRLPKSISSLIERYQMYRCIKRIKKKPRNPMNATKYILDMPESEIHDRTIKIEYSRN